MDRLMNNTKWEEIRIKMYNLSVCLKTSIRWRTKDMQNQYISSWDSEWYYHFKNGGYEMIEWIEISTPNKLIKEAVLSELQKIHVPGEIQSEKIIVYGYSAQSVNYL